MFNLFKSNSYYIAICILLPSNSINIVGITSLLCNERVFYSNIYDFESSSYSKYVVLC